MDTTAYYPKLLSLLQTKTDLILLEEKLELLSSIFGKLNINYETKLKESLDALYFNAIQQDFHGLNLNISRQEDLQKYLDFVYQKISTIPYLRLTLTKNFSKETVDAIYYWAINNLGPTVLLDINIDRLLIGGAIVEYGGKIKDYSLKNKLNEYFISHETLFRI